MESGEIPADIRIAAAPVVDQLRTRCTTEVYRHQKGSWRQVRQPLMLIEQQVFGANSFEKVELRDDFAHPATTAVLLKDTQDGQIVGYTYAVPFRMLEDDEIVPLERRDQGARTAYVSNIGILAQYRGHHLAEDLTGRLEAELKGKGYEYIEEDAAVANGYAEKIAHAYGARVEFQGAPHDSEYGPQVFFRIKL